MPEFEDHINQTCHNLDFLSFVALHSEDAFCDWKVTICFYACVHAVNSHLAKFGLQYRKHTDVDSALNPKLAESKATALSEDAYVAYSSLRKLSRRSRYLVQEGDLSGTTSYQTFEKHFQKAIRHLDTLLQFLGTLYGVSNFKIVEIKSDGFANSANLKFFSVVK